jgi:bis(5'-nucleosyl)-tetraphosphatase (symmetrical)
MSSVYAIGDVQGCLAQLDALIAKLPKKSKLICLGDLVNRGPNSLGTLRHLKKLQEQGIAECILGNHDLNLLACDAGLRGSRPLDTLDGVLKAKDRAELIDWLRHRPMALSNGHALLVHAGVLPDWDLSQTLECAHDVEKALRKSSYKRFLAEMYGNTPTKWSNSLKGNDRLRVITNALTRLRFCTPIGQMEFESKERLAASPKGYLPWFEIKQRKTANIHVIFGHWSTLGLIQRQNVSGLDTGCVWGGKLTAMEIPEQSDKKNVVMRRFIDVAGYDHPLCT